MASEAFHFITLTRCLDGGARVAEALGLPEVSALASSERACQLILRTKAKAILEVPEACPALLMYRRRFHAAVTLDEVELTLAPPKRALDWQEPVSLRLPFARWVEDDLHQAWVPALSLLVFATREALLPKQVLEQVRLVLAGRHRRLTLRDLAELTQVESLTLGTLEVTAELKTPRQLAESSAEEEKEPSMLAKLAEELPPLLATEPPEEAPPTPCCAFEMEAELRQLAEALTGDLGRSVLLVGPAGGGKTALVRELARRRRDFGLGETPFWSTTAARLMTGQIGFGLWQDRCQQLCREAARTRALVHVNHLSELLETGKTKRSEQSVGGFLRPWIARGEVTMVAECTPEQLGTIERGEPHLLSAFRQVRLAERTPRQTRAILAAVFAAAPGPTPSAARQAEVELALSRLDQLHQRYATYSSNPGRSVRFLKNLLADSFPEKALSEAAVVRAFSRETGIPLVLLDDQQALDLESTREWFARRVIGQPQAVARVLDLIAMTKARLARPRKPLASLLFIGPTGTGKTEMAKSLATFLFGDASRLARFDLNEFNDPNAVQRLIGGPGAANTEGLLTARVREQPFSVLLLDEFEKADPSFFDLLLQILGDGRLTDAAGRVADFCNSVIVMTSNLGAQGFQRGPAGFGGPATTVGAQAHFTSAVERFLRPEIFNRLDAVVPFQPLTPESLLAIARRHIDLALQRDGLRLRPVEMRVDPAVAEHLAAQCRDARYGARPLKRALERELVVPLAEALSGCQMATPARVEVTVQTGKVRVKLSVRKDAPSESAQLAGQAIVELASQIVAQRRRIGRLAGSSAVTGLENQAAMLAVLERRLERAQLKPGTPDPRLATLPGLRACLAAVDALSERARLLEDTALAAVYARKPFDRNLLTEPLEGITAEVRRIQREVFRLGHPQSDEVILALYSEDREALLRWAAAYRAAVAPLGKVVAMETLRPPTGGRSGTERLARKPVGRMDHFWADPPQPLIGLVLHLRGDLLFARLADEAGTHELQEKAACQVCLVETAAPPASAYQAPRDIERPGGITARGGRPRRRFNGDSREIWDAELGRLPWPGGDLARGIAELSETRLALAIETETS